MVDTALGLTVKAALLTVSDRALEVLLAKEESPLYTAVNECGEPLEERLFVVKVATPEPFKVEVPKVAAPSLKVTVPVGVPPDPVTVEVKVTDEPYVEGLRDEVRVFVLAFSTTRVPVAVNVVLPTLAWTVKVYVPGAVGPVVIFVNVELVLVLVTGFRLKFVVTPAGALGLQLVMLKVAALELLVLS